MDAAAGSTTIPWIVQIWLRENHQFLGNGILVAPDVVVSTFHQLFLDDEGSSDNRFIKPTRPLSVGLGGTDHDVAAICSNQDLDLAILKLARSTAVRPARFVADPGDTDSISAAVYGWLKTGDQTTLERRTDKIEITRTVEGRYWSFESGMPHGFSGSPLVFHPEGHAAVGGMVRLGRDGAAISVAIPARREHAGIHPYSAAIHCRITRLGPCVPAKSVCRDASTVCGRGVAFRTSVSWAERR